MSAPQRIVIVGGGISGLATAYFLQEAARARNVILDIHLVEGNTRLGGVIRTERVGGFVIEGGPDSILSLKPAGVALWRRLGLEGEIVGTSRENQGSFVYSRGRLRPLPEGLTLMIPSRLGPLFRTDLISWPGKVRAGLDLLLTRRTDGTDVSVAEFVQTHLGREAFERIVEPLVAGIYAGDGRALSLPATFPQLLALEQRHGSLLRGILSLSRGRQGKGKGDRVPTRPRWTPFVTLRAGLEHMIETLVGHLETVTFHLGTLATEVKRTAAGYQVRLRDGRALLGEAVVLTVPAHAAASLLRELDAPLADALAAIPYVSTATVSLAYRREDVSHPLRGFGFVVPRVEGRDLLACTWTSSKFPHRAPEGYVLIRCFLGRAGHDEVATLAEDALIALARRELWEIMGITAAPVLTRAFRWPRALPQYTVGHLERLRTIGERLAHHPGLYLTGNAYRGVGIPDCIRQAEQTARRVQTW